METKGRKKLFISGPVTGVPYYWREFEKAQGFYEEMGYAVMIPSELPVGMSNADYARICLSMIDSADEVAFLPGWRDSIGARLEHDYCYYIRKPVRLYSDDVVRTEANVDKEKCEKIWEERLNSIHKATEAIGKTFRVTVNLEDADEFYQMMNQTLAKAIDYGFSVCFSEDEDGWRSANCYAPQPRDIGDILRPAYGTEEVK